jgi:lambda family phage portal protein
MGKQTKPPGLFSRLAAATRMLFGADVGTPRQTYAGFEGASVAKRMAGWRPNPSSANELINADLPLLKARARNVYRNTPWGRSAINASVIDMIGIGFYPQPLVEDEELRKTISALWKRWAKKADARGRTTIYGLQYIAGSEMVRAGEVLIRARPRRMGEDGLEVPLQFQVLQADHLALDYNDTFNGNPIRQGIEFDLIGRRVAYHLWREHPGERPLFYSDRTRVRVPASEVCHLFIEEEPNQIRGVPWGASGLLKLRDIDLYDNNELIRKQVATLYTMFIKRKAPEAGELDDDDIPAPGDSMSSESEDGSARAVEWDPGSVIVGEEGDEPSFSDPPDTGATYDPYMKHQARMLAAGFGPIGVPYESLTGDYSQVTYLSARAALLKHRRGMESLQENFISPLLCDFVWKHFMDTAVLAGALPISVGDYQRDREKYLAVEHVPPGWDWIDPEKDIKGLQSERRAGYNSRRRQLAGRGLNIDEIDAEIAAENAKADELGLVYTSDGRQPEKGGATAQPSSDATRADQSADEQRTESDAPYDAADRERRRA